MSSCEFRVHAHDDEGKSVYLALNTPTGLAWTRDWRAGTTFDSPTRAEAARDAIPRVLTARLRREPRVVQRGKFPKQVTP